METPKDTKYFFVSSKYFCYPQYSFVDMKFFYYTHNIFFSNFFGKTQYHLEILSNVIVTLSTQQRPVSGSVTQPLKSTPAAGEAEAEVPRSSCCRPARARWPWRGRGCTLLSNVSRISCEDARLTPTTRTRRHH